ncbi:MAG: hypothetical protein SCALA701_19780 [Candidatus Scalindua sp.]|nr:MAG: hypothetical protein SCALA701_19780 [Candidatus Scalindua sp.]
MYSPHGDNGRYDKWCSPQSYTTGHEEERHHERRILIIQTRNTCSPIWMEGCNPRSTNDEHKNKGTEVWREADVTHEER